MLAAGRLRHRLKLQRPEVAVGGDGARSASWVTVADVWAAIEPLSARDLLAAQAVQSKVDVRIIIRYRTVDHTMRLVNETRGIVYAIRGVLPDPVSGREYLTLTCGSGMNAGQ